MAEEEKKDFVFSPPSLRRKEAPTPAFVEAERSATSTPEFKFNPPSARKPTPPGFGEDIGKGFVSGAAKGAVGIPGMPGSLAQMYDIAGEYGTRKLAEGAEALGLIPPTKAGQPQTAEQFMEAGKKLGQEFHKPSERELAGEVTTIGGLPVPTAHGMQQAAIRAGMPEYHPQTLPGRVAEATGELTGGSLAGPGGIGTRLAAGALGGLGSGIAGELTRGTKYEMPARLLGALPGAAGAAGISKLLEARAAPAVAERASKIAGQVAREAFAEPEKTASRLETELTLQGQPGRYVEEVQPTTAQVLGGGEAKALETRLEGMGRKEGEEDIARRKAQEARSLEATTAAAPRVPGEIGTHIKPVDMEAAVGLPPSLNPQGDAAIQVKNVVSALEKKKAEAEKTAWAHPGLQSAAIYKTKTMNELADFINSMSPSKRKALDADAMSVVEALSQTEGKNIPLLHFQDLRSQILSAARSAGEKGDYFTQHANNEVAAKLAEMLNNEKNILFGDKTGAQRNAWNTARAATKDYHDTFGPKFLSELVADMQGGGERIAGEAVFDKMFSGPNAAQNLRMVRELPGVNIDEPTTNWVIGKLTKNGTNFNVTPKDVQKFISDPKMASVIDEIPGLRGRVENIAQRAGESVEAAQKRQLTEAFQREADSNNPKRLSNFLDRNKDKIKDIAAGDHDLQNYIDALHRSSKVVSQLPHGNLTSTKTLDKLANNNIMSILYGRATGAIPDVAAAALLGHIAEGVSTAASGAPFGAAAARFLGVGKGLTAPIVSGMNSFLYGTTKDAAMKLLQEAMHDPKLMAQLMRKPSPEAFSSLSGAIAKVAEETGKAIPQVGYPAAVEQAGQPPRLQRKAGGRIPGEMTADMLMKAVDRSRKRINDGTKQILNAPDEHVVKALEVANRHI